MEGTSGWGSDERPHPTPLPLFHTAGGGCPGKEDGLKVLINIWGTFREGGGGGNTGPARDPQNLPVSSPGIWSDLGFGIEVEEKLARAV